MQPEECQQVVVLEVGVVFKQTLEHLIALLVVDQLAELRHQALDDVIHHMDRQVFDAHVEHSAALHVLRQLQRVFMHHLQQARLVLHVLRQLQRVFVHHLQQARLMLLHVLRLSCLAEFGLLQLFQAGLKAFLNQLLHDDAGVTVAH
eukprot:CAMPEP_0116983218 /NCGR_PEP_ID=MMETSP0467-20121206/60828_1 /TAXON_ID=283647 /ORGANISM="Mesodinium pulex, Strain SPMC105" /LENGTH=146 /DNA_ID=CAMNT_0004677901 /DNA_START=593 /DNA_END=1033 /DNA_ORIENTATION=-